MASLLAWIDSFLPLARPVRPSRQPRLVSVPSWVPEPYTRVQPQTCWLCGHPADELVDGFCPGFVCLWSPQLRPFKTAEEMAA